MLHFTKSPDAFQFGFLIYSMFLDYKAILLRDGVNINLPNADYTIYGEFHDAFT